MRQLASKNLTHLSPPISSTEPQPFSLNPTNSKYSEANVAIIIIVMASFAVCATSVVLAIHYCLRKEDSAARPQTRRRPSVGSIASMLGAAPTLTFPRGLKLAEAERDCTICLSEFEDGDQVKVLPRCNHGFHVRCLEQWLSSHLSCPLCRTNIIFSSVVASQPADSTSQPVIATPGSHTADAA